MFVWFAIICAVAGSILFVMGLAPRFFRKRAAGATGAGQRGRLDFRCLLGGGALAVFGFLSLVLYGACLAPASHLNVAGQWDSGISINAAAAAADGIANCNFEVFGSGIAILGAMVLYGVLQGPGMYGSPNVHVSDLPKQRVSRSVFLSNLILVGVAVVLLAGGIWLSLLGTSW